MKRVLMVLSLLMFTAACNDDSDSISLCDCEPDQYCVDDECFDTDSGIAPAPDEH